MKRINYDELILFMLLVILDLLMIVLIESDEIQNFINGHMLIFFKILVICIFPIKACNPKVIEGTIKTPSTPYNRQDNCISGSANIAINKYTSNCKRTFPVPFIRYI